MVVFVPGAAQWQMACSSYRCVQPGGVDDAQISAFQRHWQRRQKFDNRHPFGCAGASKGRVFGVLAQQVDFVVAQHRHRPAGAHQLGNARQHGRAVRAAVAKVADKHQRAPLCVFAVGAVAEVR